ncbi:MAG TPA: hypothetical protein VF516_19445, partial [Kofleriaceae bacterium]
MRLRVDRRSPGIRFESRPPALPDALPRMDVAVFVGFAASGPLHTPVAIDDPRGFANVFGDDVALGWDGEGGGVVRGNLGPAVRSFFRNGGRRCWIVRVAGAARANRFAIPGLAAWSGGTLRPACAVARSEGSWSDDLAVSASLAAQPIDLLALELDDHGRPLSAQLAVPDAVAAGDQLRITLPDSGPVLVAAIRDIDGDQISFVDDATLWFAAKLPAPPDPAALAIAWFPDDDPASEPVAQPLTPAGAPRWDADTNFAPIAVPIFAPPAGAPDAPALEPGRLVRLRWGAEELWLGVDDLVATEAGSPVQPVVELRGAWSRRLTAPPGPGTITARLSAERVRITLWVQRGTELPVRLDDLGLSPGHPSYLGALPTDRMLFSTEPPTLSDRDRDLRELTRQLQGVAGEAVDPRESYAALWRAVTVPRFSLAVPAVAIDAFVPIGLPLVPAAYLGAHGGGQTALARDGLTEFSARLFLDP